jgi:antitoxin CptB
MVNDLTQHETQLRRLQWRCRRGMLEMDLLLEKFIPLHFQQLNAAEQAAFDSLLDYPDNELWAAIVNTEHEHNESVNSSLTPEMTTEMKYVLSLLQKCCAQTLS